MLLPLGIALVVVGLVCLAYGLIRRREASAITDAPLLKTGQVAVRAKGNLASAQGAVTCPQPITAPFSGRLCLYYEIKCTARWKDGDVAKSQLVDEQKMAASFHLDDGSGPLSVDAQAGGTFEPSQKKTETKGTGLAGGVTGKDLEFGKYRVSTPIVEAGTKYEVEERVLPVVPRLYVSGSVGEGGNVLLASLLNASSRDQVLAAAMKPVKLALLAGAALFLAGSIATIEGVIRAPKEERATREPIEAPVAASIADAVPDSDPAEARAFGDDATPLPSAAASATPATSSSAAAPPPKKKKKKKKPPPTL